MVESFDYGIAHAQLMNSRSILYSCDIFPANPESSVANIPYLARIPESISALTQKKLAVIPSIYVPSDGLSYFAQHILPQIKTPFTLVSGDSDLAINHTNLGRALHQLLDSSLLLAWYAQNRDFDHDKLHSLPIGINLHNLWSNPLQWGEGFILPSLQELQIQTIAQQAAPLEQREPKIFCNWHFLIDRADRKQCFDEIDHSLCFFQAQPAPVAQTWQTQSRFQFVLSPHGAGLDCHRSWEALLLGCIPIVKAAKLNDLFENLPVIVVDDWHQINTDFLKSAILQTSSHSMNKEKLTMSYWRKKISLDAKD